MARTGTAPRSGGKGKAQRAKKRTAPAKDKKKDYKPADFEKSKPVKGSSKTRKKLQDGQKSKGEIASPTDDGKPCPLMQLQQWNGCLTASEYATQHRIDGGDVLRMQAFAAFYLRQFDEEQAALLMGYLPEVARHCGKLFIENPYVQLYLFEQISLVTEKTAPNAGQIIMAYWREANRPDVFGSSNSMSRIAALNALCKLLGLGAGPKPPKTAPGQSLAEKTGGVMQVPASVPASEWEAYARQQQAALKESVCQDAEIITTPGPGHV